MAASSQTTCSKFPIPLLAPLHSLTEEYKDYSNEEISRLVKNKLNILIDKIEEGDPTAFTYENYGWTVLSELRMIDEKERAPLTLSLITLVFEKKLLSLQPKACYEYLFAYVQDKTLLNTCAAPYFEKMLNPHQLLWFAIISGNESLALKAIESGADVNAPVHPGMSFLLLACKQGNYSIVKLLIEKKANPRFIGGTHDHETPITELGYHSKKWVRELFTKEDIAFAAEFENRKKLTHLSSPRNSQICYRSKLSDRIFFTEGARPRLFVQQVLKHRELLERAASELELATGPFYTSMVSELSDEARHLIEMGLELRIDLGQAIRSLIPALKHYLKFEVLALHRNIDQALLDATQRLERNEPVICFGTTLTTGVWQNGAPNLHAWGLVISADSTPTSKKYLVQQIDRGITNSGIISLLITKSEAIELISNYLQASNWKSYPEDSIKIQKSIHAKFDTAVDANPTRLFNLSQQTAGVCCLTSFQGVVLAYLRAKFSHSVKLATASSIAKGFTDQLFEEIFKKNILDYLDEHFSESSASLIPPDLEILTTASFTVDRLDPMPAVYIPKILSVITQENSQPTADFFERILKATKQPYDQYLFRTLDVQLISKNEPEFSKIKKALSLRSLLNEGGFYRTLEQLSFDTPIQFTKDNLDIIKQVMTHFQHFRHELPMTPAPNTLASLYFFLLDQDTATTTEEELQERFNLLSKRDQDLILSFPFFYESTSFSSDLLFAAVHNAIYDTYQSLTKDEHLEQIHSSVFELKAKTLLDAFNRMPEPYKQLFQFQLKVKSLPELAKSTAIFSQGNKLAQIIQAIHNPEGWLVSCIPGLDFAQAEPLFYLQLHNDPEYYRAYPSAAFSTTMVLRNPARLALALSLLEY
ncbi:MAG: ankyrin repeat domain-containing protein [Rhabdochlamydiaceae bacterium]|nr:ankyrin repeat domain-containing protein [Rhabdochlamydiaceae bacterium]